MNSSEDVRGVRRRGVDCGGGGGGGGRGWLGVAEGRATPAPSRGAAPPPSKIKPSRCSSFVAPAPSATILLKQPNKLCHLYILYISKILVILNHRINYVEKLYFFLHCYWVYLTAISKTRTVSSNPTCRFWVCVGVVEGEERRAYRHTLLSYCLEIWVTYSAVSRLSQTTAPIKHPSPNPNWCYQSFIL